MTAVENSLKVKLLKNAFHMANQENSTETSLKATTSDKESGVFREENEGKSETPEAANDDEMNDSGKCKAAQEKDKNPYGLSFYKGLLFLNKTISEIEGIGTMEIRENDIWVCSFPRSGTTLTQELVYLTQTLDFKTANTVQLDARFPIIDIKTQKENPIPGGLEEVQKRPSPRFVKCHLHHFLLPEQLKEGKGKVIYTARNLRDAMWSMYQFTCFMGAVMPFDKYFEYFMASRLPYTPWGRHVREFWDHKDDGNILFLKFEDTVRDMPGTVRKIARFLDRQLSDDDIDKICEHCSIGNMKKNEMTNLTYFKQHTTLNLSETHGGHVNTGTGGAWRGRMTEEMDMLIQEMIEKHLAGSGLTFDTK